MGHRMTNVTTLDSKARGQMDHQARQIVDLARAGDVAAAEALMTELIRSGHLSGQDRQGCEDEIGRARGG